MADRNNPHFNDDREVSSMEDAASRQVWEQLPADPDPREDLGYELLELETYEAEGDRILFLPNDEEKLREEAFIVAQKDDVLTLGE